MSRKLLHLAEDLRLPLAVVTEKLGFLGRTGSGKTYAAQRLAELMHAAGAQFVAFDPVGIWWGLRLAADGKSPGLANLPVFGGLQGDVPLEPTAGKLIADVIIDRGVSAVVDVSQFESDADRVRFAADFGARLFHRKKAAPSALHVFIEEAQETLPQNVGRGEERMLHVWTRMQKLGRNYGIGSSIISQRPQDVNKKALNQVELLLAFQTTGPHERKAIAGWIEEKGLDEDIAADLPKLKRGEPHAWSPGWLSISKVVAISQKETFDASSTPTVGTRAKVRELAPIDIAQLGAQIEQSKERAKGEDPKILQAKVRELEAELKKRKTPAADPDAIKRAVDQAVERERALMVKGMRLVMGAKMKALRGAYAKLEPMMKASFDQLTPLARAIVDVEVDLLPGTLPSSSSSARTAPAVVPDPATRREASSAIAQRADALEERTPARSSNGKKGAGIRQKVLDSLAAFEAMGVHDVARPNVAYFAGVSHEGGYFTNNLGAMRTEGLVEYPTDGTVALTEAGRAIATAPDAPMTLQDLHGAWISKLEAIQGRMLRHLIAIYPNSCTRAELGEAIGANIEGGYFTNNLGRLRALGVADYPTKGTVVATDLLFPEGLR